MQESETTTTYMKYYIFSFIAVLMITGLFGGNSHAKKYRGVGVSDVKIDDSNPLPAQKQEGMVGEIILVDTTRPHYGSSSVTDTAT